MTGNEIIDLLRKSIARSGPDRPTDQSVANFLGLTAAGFAKLQKRQEVSGENAVSLMISAAKAARTRAYAETIRPIVEFFPCNREPVATGNDRQILDAGTGRDRDRNNQILKKELETCRGVYIFYDSAGSAIYVGGSKRNSLWAEINLAYNRARSVRNIFCVQHAARLQSASSSGEKRSQVRSTSLPLRDLAGYVSAYHVAEEMIADVEALLLNGFPNNLLNTKIENFSWG